MIENLIHKTLVFFSASIAAIITLSFLLASNIMGKLIRVYVGVTWMGFLFFSCDNQKEEHLNYYNIDSLVTAQVRYLTEVKASVEKEVTMQGKTDKTILLAEDTSFWSNELDIFRQLKILNKPIHVNSYTIEITADPNSNLTIKSFTSQKKLPLVYFKIYCHNYPSNLYRIEALINEDNYLYSSSQKFRMEFENIYNKRTLTNYLIEVRQKMRLRDSTKFSVQGKVTIN